MADPHQPPSSKATLGAAPYANNDPQMQAALLKLVLACKGRHPELDKHIQRLGVLTTEGAAKGRVAAALDLAAALIVAQGLLRGDQNATTRKLADLLDTRTHRPEFAQKTRFLRNRLRDATTQEEIDWALSELVGLITILEQRAAYKAESMSGAPDFRAMTLLLDELQLPEATQLAMAPHRAQLARPQGRAAQVSCVRELAKCLATHFRPPGLPPHADEALGLARQQLQHLVNNLTLPTPLADDQARLQRQIAGAASAPELSAAAQVLVQLLQTSQGTSRLDISELGNFLKLIAKRIEEFKRYLARSDETHVNAVESATSLQRQMSGQVSVLRHAVDDENNFSALKPAVIDQLESLETSINTFVRNEEIRHGGATLQMNAVSGRLKELESETQRLRADLKAQRILTLIDPLTGVFNRLGYSEAIAREHARWQRYGGSLSIAMCDLDLFKNINDRYGHAAGDKVLASVAELLGTHIRNCDVLCRLGGEEFAVILPETTIEGAKIAAEKLRISVFESKFRFKHAPVSVSISVGVAQFRAEDTVMDVYERADRALYVAKAQGRNRSCSEQDLSGELDPDRLGAVNG